jgi:hypothetical protein
MGNVGSERMENGGGVLKPVRHVCMTWECVIIGGYRNDKATVRATSDNMNKQKAKGKTSDIYVMNEYVHT